MTVSSLWNGERSVVLLYLARVFSSSFASPLFFHESLALLLLALAALFIEISADASSHALHRFKTRPGASSGILLGTITLPSVMLSRLIQLSRALLQNEIEPEELEFLKMQYWAISASCFGVLVLLYVVMQNSSSRSSQPHAGGNAICGLLFLAVYGVLCCISLSSKSQGLHVGMKMMWIICHGLASASLIQHIFHTFPLCASIGEALLVAGGIVLYFGDMLALTLAKINEHSLSLKLTSLQFGIRRSEISTILQGVLFGLLLLPVVYKIVLQVWVYFTRIIKYRVLASKVMTCEGPGRSAVFYFSMVLALVIIAPMWMQFVHDFHGHPLLWIFSFVFTEPFKRLSLCIYWIFVICASVFRFYNISKNSKIERILLRKYYHLVAVIMFVPALLFQPKFIDLAFGAALAVFLALEMIRVWKIWPLGQLVHQFMNAFTDHRDSDILIISHFSLLLGCALPKWMSSGFNDRPLAPFAGILSLGIGDTMASMVGHKYGVLRWSKSGKKTIEGTAAGITAVLAACSILVPVLASTSFILSQHWLSLIVAVTVSGMLEAYTAQLDNAFIPLVFYTLLCL